MIEDVQIIRDTREEKELNSYASKYCQIILDNREDTELAVALAQNNYGKHVIDNDQDTDGQACTLYFEDGSALRCEVKDGRQHFKMGWGKPDQKPIEGGPVIVTLRDTVDEKDKASHAYGFLAILTDHVKNPGKGADQALKAYREKIFDKTVKGDVMMLAFIDGSTIRIERHENGESIAMGWLPDDMQAVMFGMLSRGMRPIDMEAKP